MTRRRLLAICGMSLAIALLSSCGGKPFYRCVDMAGAKRYSDTPCVARETSEDLPAVLRGPPNVRSESGLLEAVEAIIVGKVMLEPAVLNRVFRIAPEKREEDSASVWYQKVDAGGINYLYVENKAVTGRFAGFVLSMRIDRNALCIEPGDVVERFGSGSKINLPQQSQGKFSVVEYTFPPGASPRRTEAQIRISYELQPKPCAIDIWMNQNDTSRR